MFYYHKIKYASTNQSQINNLLQIIRNQLYVEYEDNIYITNILIDKKNTKHKKYKFLRNQYLQKYSYTKLPTLFFNF